MFKCDNCGGELVFDPDTQSLKCQSCNTYFNISPKRDKEIETAEDGYFEADVFTCPNCGGELIGLTESIVSFCPFCGSEVEVQTKKLKKKLPELIVPFEIGRRECRDIYKEGVQRFVFAPREMSSEKFIDRIQGVYIPYWYYVCNFEGFIKAEFLDVERDRAYIDKKYYHIKKKVTGHISVPRDASKNLDDDLSIEAGGFDDYKVRPFSPQYLCGFYADLPDVSSDHYFDESAKAAKEAAIDRSLYEIDELDLLHYDDSELDEEVEAKSLASPMYLVTWKDNSKISYSLINGQNGEFSARLPVDNLKFLFISLLIAIPTFILLYFGNIALMPNVLSVYAGIGLMISMIFGYYSGRKALDKEKIIFGYPGKKRKRRMHRKIINIFQNIKKLLSIRGNRFVQAVFGPFGIMFVIWTIQISLGELANAETIIKIINVMSSREVLSFLRMVVLTVGIYYSVRTLICTCIAFKCTMKHKDGWFLKIALLLLFDVFFGFLGIILSGYFSASVLPNNQYYYFIAIYSLTVSFVILFNLVREYNISVTRPIKYFEERKGLKDHD